MKINHVKSIIKKSLRFNPIWFPSFAPHLHLSSWIPNAYIGNVMHLHISTKFQWCARAKERERLKEIHIENRERRQRQRQKLQQRTIKKNSLQFALVQANAFLKPEILILIWNEKFRLNIFAHATSSEIRWLDERFPSQLLFILSNRDPFWSLSLLLVRLL